MRVDLGLICAAGIATVAAAAAAAAANPEARHVDACGTETAYCALIEHCCCLLLDHRAGRQGRQGWSRCGIVAWTCGGLLARWKARG